MVIKQQHWAIHPTPSGVDVVNHMGETVASAASYGLANAIRNIPEALRLMDRIGELEDTAILPDHPSLFEIRAAQQDIEKLITFIHELRDLYAG